MTPQLNGIFFGCWNKLSSASSKDSALRNITVCNYAPEDINAYTVVLREANAQTYNLLFYTDHRSPKVEQLKRNGKVAVVIYSEEEKLQLTIKGEATVHYENEVSERYWQKNGYKSRRSYLAQPAPSTEVLEPGDGLAYLNNKEFDEQDVAGYENFAVVIIKSDYLEYLQLNREGNQRARFTRTENEEWEGTWLIP